MGYLWSICIDIKQPAVFRAANHGFFSFISRRAALTMLIDISLVIQNFLLFFGLLDVTGLTLTPPFKLLLSFARPGHHCWTSSDGEEVKNFITIISRSGVLVMNEFVNKSNTKP